MHASKLLPIASGILMLMLVFVGLRSCEKPPDAEATGDIVPKAPAPDADSPADTIRTLIAEVAEIKAQNTALTQHNQELIRQRDEIENQVTGKVREAMDGQDSAVDRLTARVDALKSRVEDIGSQSVTADSDIPPGLGIGDGAVVGPDGPQTTITWIEPLNQPAAGSRSQQSAKDDGESLLHTNVPSNASKTLPKQPQPPKPAYTVPRNATLVGSTGMTALIGRIPFDGQVEDPFPFKVLVGRDNLAANGLEIPGVYGMVFSGETFGDWALSCVRGKIRSVTYLFDDGTIRTLSSDDNSLQQIATQQPSNSTGVSQRGPQGARQNADLGWISDRRGIPCVTGERISNAGSYLAGRILARAAEAAANGFGFNEATLQVSPLTGVSTTNITGDAAKFAGYNALSGAAAEISDYIKERAAQSFDVVYVDTGANVAVHVDRELPIDYNPTGRKLTYASSNTQTLVPDLD